MIYRLGEQQRRALALLILAGVIVCLVVLVGLPIWSANAYYEQNITDKQHRMEILKRSAGIGIQLETRLKNKQGVQETATHYLKSQSEAAAAAELQRILKRAITQHGGELQSTQILPTKTEQGFVRISIKVGMRGGLESLVGIFYQIETQKPYLFLDNISVRGRAIVRKRFSRKTLTQQTAKSVLDVNFELTGYMREAA